MGLTSFFILSFVFLYRSSESFFVKPKEKEVELLAVLKYSL